MGKRPRYTKEFKISAAKLVLELGYTYKSAGEQLGCSSWSIRQWVKQLRRSGDIPPTSETGIDEHGVKQLQQENARLRMENEILKKAAAYFAKESL